MQPLGGMTPRGEMWLSLQVLLEVVLVLLLLLLQEVRLLLA